MTEHQRKPQMLSEADFHKGTTVEYRVAAKGPQKGGELPRVLQGEAEGCILIAQHATEEKGDEVIGMNIVQMFGSYDVMISMAVTMLNVLEDRGMMMEVMIEHLRQRAMRQAEEGGQ